MACCDGIIKYLLFFFNLVFSLSGLALIVAGSVLLSQSSELKDVLNEIKSGFLAPQVVLIVLGVIVFITASLGCCGAIQENRCKLITYAVLLLSIFIVELGIGIYAAINLGDLQNLVEKEMRRYFDTMFGYPERIKAFNNMEKFLQCCGVNSFADYTFKLKPIPDSCLAGESSLELNYWKEGCAVAVTDLSTKAGQVVAILGIVLACIEIIGASFALRLASLVDRVY